MFCSLGGGEKKKKNVLELYELVDLDDISSGYRFLLERRRESLSHPRGEKSAPMPY